MKWVDSISKVPFILKIYDSRKKNPETCFVYLLVCHSKTYNRNCNVRTLELIFQCFSQYLDFRSHHNPQLLPVTIILWISGSPVRLVWDNPEPRRKRCIYISVTISSQTYLILIKALVTVCILKCSDVWLLRSSHIVRGRNRKQCEGIDLQFQQHAYHSLTLAQSCDLMISVSQNSVLQRV